MGKKKNWDIVRNQKDLDTVKYRDVFEDQQLERGSIEEKKTMKGRLILAASLSAVLFIVIWLIVTAIQMYTRREGLDDDADPRDDYIFVEEHYENKDDPQDILTVDEYNEWYKIYHDYDSKRKDSDEPPQVPVDDMTDFINQYSYNSDEGVYYINNEPRTKEEYAAEVKAHYAEYEKAKEAYDLYYKQHTDPEYHKDAEKPEGYVKTIAHYKNVSDTTQYLTVENYKKAVEEYDAKVKEKLVSEDQLSIPLKPINFAAAYKGDDLKCMTNAEAWALSGEDKSDMVGKVSKERFDEFLQYCSDNGIKINESPFNKDGLELPDAADSAAVAAYAKYQGFYDELKSLFSSYKKTSYSEYWDLLVQYTNDVHYDRNTNSYNIASTCTYVPTVYRNTFDGTTISVLEYTELKNKFSQDISAYNKEYLIHRKAYHPDDIDGTLPRFKLGPNMMKVLVSFVGALFVFGLMAMLLNRNLKAQNLMSDTSDINQYHNDQHIALPEEIQQNYDWFPDVGAHSAVQVSSMISHMALSNKGLKNVMLARRAKEDIKDENGDIEYYKGEILLDDKGDPITDNVSIIDNEFMEALFDASKAPKNKTVRHYYDTTKIPYNPDGSNRDKLGKYETVADLINSDWEFPIYEPQRPAGAYIVDTAPVVGYNAINT